MGLSCAPKQVGFPDPETSMLGAGVALLRGPWGPGVLGKPPPALSLGLS